MSKLAQTLQQAGSMLTSGDELLNDAIVQDLESAASACKGLPMAQSQMPEITKMAHLVIRKAIEQNLEKNVANLAVQVISSLRVACPEGEDPMILHIGDLLTATSILAQSITTLEAKKPADETSVPTYTQEEIDALFAATVSYTHLTLPTKRIV